ncbi:hypothetical protein B0H19DRAFT_1072596 [Mycena capillaripes]|nr:hypothetical protein B0H19DRAFT_1072596 [Mycena capillaripes]
MFSAQLAKHVEVRLDDEGRDDVGRDYKGPDYGDDDGEDCGRRWRETGRMTMRSGFYSQTGNSSSITKWQVQLRMNIRVRKLLRERGTEKRRRGGDRKGKRSEEKRQRERQPTDTDGISATRNGTIEYSTYWENTRQLRRAELSSVEEWEYRQLQAEG